MKYLNFVFQMESSQLNLNMISQKSYGISIKILKIQLIKFYSSNLIFERTCLFLPFLMELQIKILITCQIILFHAYVSGFMILK